MALLAERLRNSGPDMNSPIADATGIEGGWDFTLVYSMRMMAMRAGGPPLPPPPGMGGGGAGGPGPGPGGDAMGAGASDPMGGYTVFEAIEKQLGLKLEKTKRPGQVFVIDHIEQKPTEN
jgi:uncharacterized protein (TIGR03435 family)